MSNVTHPPLKNQRSLVITRVPVSRTMCLDSSPAPGTAIKQMMAYNPDLVVDATIVCPGKLSQGFIKYIAKKYPEYVLNVVNPYKVWFNCTPELYAPFTTPRDWVRHQLNDVISRLGLRGVNNITGEHVSIQINSNHWDLLNALDSMLPGLDRDACLTIALRNAIMALKQ